MSLNLKVFGERNTATRAIIQMLRKVEGVNLNLGDPSHALGNVAWAELNAGINLYYKHEYRQFYMDGLRDNMCHETNPLRTWKHAAPRWHTEYQRRSVNVLFSVRNPYSWALSMARKPYHMKAPRTADFETFISRPWLTERRDNTEIVLPSVIDLWNRKVQGYIDFATDAHRCATQTAFIRFEEFVSDPSALMTRVLENFKSSTGQISSIKSSTKNKGKPLKQLQDYYACEDWKQRLTASNVKTINSILDADIAQIFHYVILDPKDFPDRLPLDVQKQFSYEMMNLDRTPEIDLASKTG